MAKDLSPKQDSILRFIRQFLDEHDYPPSIRQIQEGCGISSTSVVDYNLKALERLGLIRRDREVVSHLPSKTRHDPEKTVGLANCHF